MKIIQINKEKYTYMYILAEIFHFKLILDYRWFNSFPLLKIVPIIKLLCKFNNIMAYYVNVIECTRFWCIN